MQDYLTSVTAAALLIALLQAISPKNNTIMAVMKLLTGLYMVITLITPMKTIPIKNYLNDFPAIQDFASTYAAEGDAYRDASVSLVITEQVESYIKDKAAALGATVQVEITLCEEEPPSPISVHIRGNISPYVKNQLGRIIEDSVGIPKEQQTWS